MKVTSTQSKFYIGDPCYAMTDGHYDSLIEVVDRLILKEILPGSIAFAGSTKFGDGEYDGFGVDSGLLGAIPIELCDQANLAENPDFTIWEASEIEVSYEDGRFEFTSKTDHLTIETDDCQDEEDDDDWEEE